VTHSSARRLSLFSCYGDVHNKRTSPVQLRIVRLNDAGSDVEIFKDTVLDCCSFESYGSVVFVTFRA